MINLPSSWNILKTQLLGVFVVLCLAACSSQVELVSSLQETEANQVLAELLQVGIPAQKTLNKDGIASIQVDAKDISRALDTLSVVGLPRSRYSGFGEVFKKDGLISSPLEERARYIYSLSQELEHTLSQIDGVLSARVHVVLPERGAAGDPSLPSSASVFLKYRPDFDLDYMTPQIRRLVANSIPGLNNDKISVVLFPAQNTERIINGPTQTSVLGFTVNTESARALSITLAIGLILLLILGGAIGYIVWMWRKNLKTLLRKENR